jgi:hypothetical protein
MNNIFDLFKEILNLIRTSSTKDPDQKTENKQKIRTSKEAYEWFLNESENKKSTRIEENKDPLMQPGKIYIFKYEPKYEDSLSYYDKHPIVLALGTVMGEEGKMILGLNISWYPPSARKYIVNKIREIYKPSYENAIKNSPFSANKQGIIYLNIFNLKTALDNIGFSFAIRQYIPSRIKSPKVCVCYEDWDKAILLDQPRIFPELHANDPYYSLKNIYEEFKKYLLYYRNNRASIKAKMDEAKKNGKYKLIR